jgi:hypothetical protein
MNSGECGGEDCSAIKGDVIYSTTNTAELATNYNGLAFTSMPASNSLVCISVGTNGFDWAGKIVFN